MPARDKTWNAELDKAAVLTMRLNREAILT